MDIKAEKIIYYKPNAFETFQKSTSLSIEEKYKWDPHTQNEVQDGQKKWIRNNSRVIIKKISLTLVD